jgi:hypothetical protein
MKWRANQARTIATSECGNYELKLSTDPERGDFYNAWHVPSGKHVGADHEKKRVVAACEAHAQRSGA